MKHVLLVLPVLALVAAGVALSATATPPEGTATIALPSDAATAFKPGSGVETARRYCLTCHSAGYIATQPALTSAQWTAEVTKMQRAYGAQIPANAVPTLVQYLVSAYGKQ